jgi:Ca2+-transporting ATPase
VFAGTLVVRGQGTVEVRCHGRAPSSVASAHSLRDISTGASPLQAELAPADAAPGADRHVLCVLLALLHAQLRGGWLEGLLAGITLAMGILPQEFPVILIVFLAHSVRDASPRTACSRAGWRDRNAGADHGAVRRQDRHPDAQPHGGGGADRRR